MCGCQATSDTILEQQTFMICRAELDEEFSVRLNNVKSPCARMINAMLRSTNVNHQTAAARSKPYRNHLSSLALESRWNTFSVSGIMLNMIVKLGQCCKKLTEPLGRHVVLRAHMFFLVNVWMLQAQSSPTLTPTRTLMSLMREPLPRNDWPCVEFILVFSIEIPTCSVSNRLWTKEMGDKKIDILKVGHSNRLTSGISSRCSGNECLRWPASAAANIVKQKICMIIFMGFEQLLWTCKLFQSWFTYSRPHDAGFRFISNRRQFQRWMGSVKILSAHRNS